MGADDRPEVIEKWICQDVSFIYVPSGEAKLTYTPESIQQWVSVETYEVSPLKAAVFCSSRVGTLMSAVHLRDACCFCESHVLTDNT